MLAVVEEVALRPSRNHPGRNAGRLRLARGSGSLAERRAAAAGSWPPLPASGGLVEP